LNAYGIQQEHVDDVIRNKVLVDGPYGMLVEDDDLPQDPVNNVWFDNDRVDPIEESPKLSLQRRFAMRGGIYDRHNLLADPLSCDAKAGNFTPSPESLAVNRGANANAHHRFGWRPF